MRRSGSSCSSSTSPMSGNSSKHISTPICSNSTTLSALPPHSHTTNLHLGLSINSSSPLLDQTYAINLNASTTADEYHHHCDDQDDDENDNECAATLFVKVYMEGHPIGRKLDILAHRCYQQLIATLDHMFNANILWGEEVDPENCEDFHVLTYEDEDGDWLMVGDVPWEMFLSTVKRLKITRACPC